jgi:hypothetical protein
VKNNTRRICVFLALGAAVAALAPTARAQDINQRLDQRSESYSRNEYFNYGLPKNPRQAPSLGLGNIYGLNPCATGVSVGATTPLIGIGGAFSTIDEECQIRNNVAITVTALKDEALAREIMCSVEGFRQAAIRVGRPCIRDGGTAIALSEGVNPELATSAQLAPLQAQPGLPPNALPPVPGPQPAPPPDPPGIPSLRGGFRGVSAESPVLPAFCGVAGLNLQLYPECDPGRPAALSSPAPRRAREASSRRRPSGTAAARPVPKSDPQPAQQPVAADPARPPQRSDGRDNSGSAARPQASLPGARLSVAGCEAMPSSLHRAYPECSPQNIAELRRQSARSLVAGLDR